MDLSQARKKWYELRNLAAPVYRGAIVEIDQQLSTFLGNQTKKRLSMLHLMHQSHLEKGT
ncbi:hypothetical protein RirG_016600 [Rhizophagus irregularis DAOM 197198w]|uniref:Uncharacterized protein n=1 Tax=Rhizophagus irregularis (strain DAOM 197198w) TaxID=1432141 RepID=A0A015LZW8_RHIIW|nr:hypothetical protein RirG_016600 [Rhizophagus irregularis DAOM 197198w]EXX78266.1 hypothetical protein RirG_016600 [Rhizophagus irregularis DAOM 197198w]